MKNNLLILFLVFYSSSSFSQEKRYSVYGCFDDLRIEPKNIIFYKVETGIRIYDNYNKSFTRKYFDVKLSDGSIRKSPDWGRYNSYIVYIDNKRVGDKIDMIIMDSLGNDTISITILEMPAPKVKLYNSYGHPPGLNAEKIFVDDGSILGLYNPNIICDYKVTSFEVEVYSPERNLVYREKIIGYKFSSEFRVCYSQAKNGTYVKVRNVMVKACNGQTYVCEALFIRNGE